MSTPTAPSLHHGHPPSVLLTTLLTTIQQCIIPLTTVAVSRGCKVFGASILSKRTLQPIVSSTNDEITSPLLHGETSTLFKFHAYNAALPESHRVDPKECVFLSTHEPCSLCLSAITWSGFDNFYYLFTYKDTMDTFAIPHDINILKQVFQTNPIPDVGVHSLYNRCNAYWQCFSLDDLIAQSPEAERQLLKLKLELVKTEYNELSQTYQLSKPNQVPGQIPLA